MKKRPKAPEQSGGGSDWLTTYCDMVTLLFAFFVLLFAISQVDVQKFNLLAASLSNKGASPERIMELGLRNTDQVDLESPKIPASEGEIKDKPLEDAYNTIKEALEASGVGQQVSVALGDDYIFIRFVDEMLFHPNSAVIRPQDYQYLDFVGKSLKMIEGEVGMIRIDGHTAAVLEQDNYPVSDRDLSSARSNAVLKYFEDTIGISGDKLTSYAWGKHKDIASNATEEGRSKNRRIEILVTKTNEIEGQLDNIYEKLLQ